MLGDCSCLSENIDPLPAIYMMIVCLVISCVLFVCMNERVGGSMYYEQLCIYIDNKPAHLARYKQGCQTVYLV